MTWLCMGLACALVGVFAAAAWLTRPLAPEEHERIARRLEKDRR